MKNLKVAALAAILVLEVSSAAMAQYNPKGANTSDPGDAPGMKAPQKVKPANDTPAKANTADPGDAPGMKATKVKRPAKDEAAKANTADPGSTSGKK